MVDFGLKDHILLCTRMPKLHLNLQSAQSNGLCPNRKGPADPFFWLLPEARQRHTSDTTDSSLMVMIIMVIHENNDNSNTNSHKKD